MVTILADRNIPWLELLPKQDVTLVPFETTDELTQFLPKADALLVRTVHKIKPEHVPPLPKKLRFVGSATAGTDHVDVEWLRKNDVAFAHSPGCNARAVAEYVATTIFAAFNGNIDELKSKKAGIVGFGNTGKQLAGILELMGIPFIANDPPLEEKSSFRGCTFEEILQCDIISFHIPLTKTGKWPTNKMMGKERLENCNAEVIINASRGGVIDEDTLARRASTNGKIAVTDVWKNEPITHPLLLNKSLYATPHIAGYSQQAKFKATEMVVNDLCSFFGITKPEALEPSISTIINASDGLLQVIKQIHPLFTLTEKLKANPASFAELRNKHPLRNEYRNYVLENLPKKDRIAARALGFEVV